MKVIGGQTKLGKTCLILRGEMVFLVSKINKYKFQYTVLLLKILRCTVIIFMHFLVKKNPKESNLCCHSSGQSINFLWLSPVSHETEVSKEFIELWRILLI